ncbi:MAG TPA: FAD-binding oxidoreductase [Dehalococcoidia bacterium]|nr:FAD-binding oxidoreductase [Dehalococcoidia bacterium]
MVQILSNLSESVVRQFRESLTGNLLEPNTAEYEAARTIYNGMIDNHPGLIVQPANTADVQTAVNFARENNLLISVKGGGHAASGHAVCEGGLMIDLALLKDIEVDPAAQTAVAGGGVNWGELDAATQEHGLAVTGGRNPTTGIGGLTLGSGSGWLERKLGYTVDNLLGAEAVSADGEVRWASEDENPDLFWGLQGGGGNFGVVTKFKYQLHKVGPMVFGGQLGFPRFMAKDVIRAYRDFIENAPDDIGGGVALITAPDMDPVPPPVRGMLVLGVVVAYFGDPADGPAAIKPLLDLNPVLNMTSEMPYLALQSMLEAGQQPGLRNYWKADMYPELPDEMIDTLVEQAEKPPVSPSTTVLLQPLGGQVHRVDDDASAMGWRSAKWAVHALGMWEDPAEDDAQIVWVRALASSIEPWAQAGTYLNYLMDEGEGRVRASFGPKYDRMVELKNKYDPTNLFSLNQNIKPTA